MLTHSPPLIKAHWAQSKKLRPCSYPHSLWRRVWRQPLSPPCSFETARIDDMCSSKHSPILVASSPPQLGVHINHPLPEFVKSSFVCFPWAVSLRRHMLPSVLCYYIRSPPSFETAPCCPTMLFSMCSCELHPHRHVVKHRRCTLLIWLAHTATCA